MYTTLKQSYPGKQRQVFMKTAMKRFRDQEAKIIRLLRSLYTTPMKKALVLTEVPPDTEGAMLLRLVIWLSLFVLAIATISISSGF